MEGWESSIFVFWDDTWSPIKSNHSLSLEASPMFGLQISLASMPQSLKSMANMLWNSLQLRLHFYCFTQWSLGDSAQEHWFFIAKLQNISGNLAWPSITPPLYPLNTSSHLKSQTKHIYSFWGQTLKLNMNRITTNLVSFKNKYFGCCTKQRTLTLWDAKERKGIWKANNIVWRYEHQLWTYETS